MSAVIPQSSMHICKSEYGQLAKVILCPPKYMNMDEVINETQKHFIGENINQRRAMRQHRNFVQTLRNHDVETILLDADASLPEQVFTRDIGFTIGERVFISGMNCPVRQGEEKKLKDWLLHNGISFTELVSDSIEGGDVLVDGQDIFIGISERTGAAAVEELHSYLPQYKIIPMPFDKKYLHLDCVFNIISPKEALIYPKAFTPKQLEELSSRYELIEVDEDEQFTLGTNMLSIGNKKIVSLPINKKVNKKLAGRGYEVIEVDLTEIIKSGGSFRCCTMPLSRY